MPTTDYLVIYNHHYYRLLHINESSISPLQFLFLVFKFSQVTWNCTRDSATKNSYSYKLVTRTSDEQRKFQSQCFNSNTNVTEFLALAINFL